MTVGPGDSQLVLKVTPPRVPRTLLERPRLSSLRPEFADKSVIVLQAPAGFGKTSLLAQWRKEALQSGAVVAWLTLDGRDTDSRLVAGLTASMRVASGRPNFGQACLGAAGLEAVRSRHHAVAGGGRRPGGRHRPVPRRRARAARGDAAAIARLPAAQRAGEPADHPGVTQAGRAADVRPALAGTLRGLAPRTCASNWPRPSPCCRRASAAGSTWIPASACTN